MNKHDLIELQYEITGIIVTLQAQGFQSNNKPFREWCLEHSFRLERINKEIEQFLIAMGGRHEKA